MNKSRTYALVTGQSGTGKSYFVKNYVIPKLVQSKPVFIFDLLNEYDKKAFQGTGSKKITYYKNFHEFIFEIAESGFIEQKIHVIAWKQDSTIINAIHFFRRLEKPVSLVFEEMHSLFSDTDLKRAIGKELKEITFYGRHFGIDCILITQRPKSLSTDIRSQVPFCVSFRQTLSADIDALKEIEDKAGEVVIDLKPYHFYTMGNEVPKVFKDLKLNKIQKL